MEAKCRAKKNASEKEIGREKNKLKMTEKRANMTEEEKEKVKEKDRLRKKKMREKKKQEKMMDLKRRVKAGEFAHKGT